MNTEFAYALIRTAPTVPADVINTGNRFNIYRNNYLTGLIGTLSAKFPVTCQLVGSEYFEAVAHSYVTEASPSSPLLDHYGEDFANFLETTALLAPPAYLPDVARVEWARSVAPIAAQRPTMQITNREDLERAFEMQFQLAPGGTLITSAYPVGTIWDHHQTAPVKPIPEWKAETVAVWWSCGHIQQKTIPPNISPILRGLEAGIPLLNFLNDATSEEQAIQLISTFTSLVHQGLLIPGQENTEKHDHEF